MSNYIRTAVSFEQLSEDQQHEVLERFREINVEDEFWYELAVEEFKEDLRGRGLSCNDVCFSFGYSQSDYASFDAKLVDYEAFLSGMELTEKEKLVVSLYYYDELTMKEISLIMHLSEARICQLHTKAIFKLRGFLANMNEL